MKDIQVFRLIVIAAMTITIIIGLQTYWVVSTWNLNEQEFNQKVSYALYRVAIQLAEINESDLPPREVIQRRSSNYYIVNIESEIDFEMLEFFLQKELEAMVIHTDFEYAVYNCFTDIMEYGNYCSYDPNKEPPSRPETTLPTQHGLNYYFGVRFPNRPGYLFDQMQLTVIFSIILFLTVIFFVYALWVVLRQKRLSLLQKDFINNMTHELKTPVSTVKVAADYLLQHPNIKSDSRLDRYARIIRDQNLRLNGQVERVLDLSRFERSGFELKKEWCNWRYILKEVLESESLQIQSRKGELALSLEGEQLELLADPFHFSNVLHSLLDNAIKYSPNGPHIQLHSIFLNGRLKLTIRDQGIGIAAEQQKRVFQKFYRVPTGNVHNVKGFGLGLYYVQQICRAHHWKLELDSKEMVGTAVHIIFPKSALRHPQANH